MKQGLLYVTLIAMVLGCGVVNGFGREPCTGVLCQKGKKCSTVYTENGGPTAICGENPCINYKCCGGKGGICEKDGCYLIKTGPYQVEPVCLDSCRRNKIKCETPGEYCYTTKVVCIQAPCNPVPECRAPCDTPNVNICDTGYKCEVRYENCTSDPKKPNYNPYCKPKEVCVRESNKCGSY